ncbi:MAG: hypothetical protein JWM19_4990 [Actinomycetia bacterium]|nr:hypothetical protein [Actinomycetes bacterium]
MADDVHQVIGAALALLAVEDPAAADDAQAALEWIAGDHGLELVTQHRVQNFCWYELPVKWMTGPDGHAQVAAALARAFDLLQMPRYAAICRSATTRDILAAYQTGTEKGKAAFRRAVTTSGITPPDLPGFTWGAGMGSQEAGAWTSATELLELAIASGDLAPGARGWKARQQELVRTHLDAAREELLGQSLAAVIVSERAEAWVNRWRSPTRQQVAAAVANRLLHPVQLPAEAAADPLPRWRWLLGQLADGIPLTQTGNLSRAFVQQNADRFGWDLSHPPYTETDLYDLHQLRCLAREHGITRRAGRVLTLTAKGRRMLDDPGHLWRSTAAALADGNSFTVFAGEIFLAMLADGGPVPASQVTATVAQAAAEEQFRDSRTGQPPGEHDVSWAISRTANLCRALGLLAPGSDWPDRRYQLTPVGTATALEALRACATGPRVIA